MGILNITADSFFDGGKYLSETAMLKRAETMLDEGAAIIDIGAVSTRPGSKAVSAAEELSLVAKSVKTIAGHFPEAIISVDTYRSHVARMAAAQGAHIINDISGGTMDPLMHKTLAALDAAYVLMHIQGTPENMQDNPEYENVGREVARFFDRQLESLTSLGKSNIILDPGFGFGKSVAHNYELLNNLENFCNYPYPLLAGVSRKSMINRVLNTSPAGALNGTTVLNTIALLKGALILRVHDVKPATEAIKLVAAMKKYG
ncbi:dihydropteroate synthase [Lentimicrobium sp.]|uniref:dihydropteroate synthase n=1 Tax=Lentimicrobium sp. TaxID=2034841 RepID=UPI002CFBE27D|nr:dihydropteroate synthase [Lentimicrobium sp.]HPJ62301.1 dihydropteroate synthase [Lentimicrobium sp.]HRW68229.1 dihydropteroate synthase [Lentimicrobium sp.]